MKILQDISQKCWRSLFYRHLLFALSTVISISFAGYYFGTFDQGINIPFLKKYIDASLFPRDPFLDLRLTHYSYFWFLFKPFYQLGVLEISIFIIYLLVIYTTFWALWKLSKTLFNNALVSFLTVISFILPHFSFGGFPLIEFSLLNRTFVLPFLLLSIDLFLNRRYLLAFFLLGLMYNLHVISVNFILFMLLFECVVQFRKNGGWRTIILGISAFVIGALPVLIWKLSGTPVDLTLRPEWFSIVSRGVLDGFFYLFVPYPHVLLMTLSGFSTIVIFFIARAYSSPRRHDQTVTNFVFAALIVLGVEIITAQWYAVTIIIQSQIIRIGLFLLIFGYLYFVYYITEKYQAGMLKVSDFALFVGALIFSILPVVVLITWFFHRLVSKASWRWFPGACVIALAFIGALIISYQKNIWRPGIHIFAQHSPWYDVQVWARDHTPKERVFITPPHMQDWWFYYLDWRVVSERSTVVTLSDLTETILTPQYITTWKTRFEELAPRALNSFRGNIFENIEITNKAYYSLTKQNILRIAKKYEASYLVVKKPHRYAFPEEYENSEFIVYGLNR